MNDIKRFNELYESIVNSGHDITVYHGDNFGTDHLNPKLMNNGNNQEGIGIYFSDSLSTAKSYGKNIIKATINKSKLINARKTIENIHNKGIINILKDMYKVDIESMFYLVTDYGVYLEEPEDLTLDNIEELYNLMIDEEIRNFQITMAETFNVIDFVKSWNKHTDIDGTYFNKSFM